MLTPISSRRLNYHRASLARGLASLASGAEPRVDRTGGEQGAGLIRGFSMISRGEALGHYEWIDQTMVAQVHEAALQAGGKGIKVRFTHPGLSADGLGSFLGRAHASSRSDDQAFADLHFSETSRKTPDGDLGNYVLSLAENESDMFGASIVFQPDFEAADQFAVEHGAVWRDDPYYGRYLDMTTFKSPDPLNVNNYPHSRLAALHAVDIVDDPAANPDGLFHRQSGVAHEATALAAFALGLPGAERPRSTSLNMDPDRVQSFVARFLDQHGLVLSRKDDSMPSAAPAVSTSTPPAPVTPAAPAVPLSTGAIAPSPAPVAEPAPVQITRDQLASWSAEFGAENAVKWLSAGHDLGEARRLHTAVLQEQLKASKEETQSLRERLASAKVGETENLSADIESVESEKPAVDPTASGVDRLTAANEARLKRKG